MLKENVILITMDAVRPDRLSCYGYEGIETKGIDSIAKEGTLFRNCIATSCLTPVACASILSGKNPNKTGMRNPFGVVAVKMLPEILKEQGYKTGGFVGIDLLDSKHGFSEGFDCFDSPTSLDSFHTMQFQGEDKKQLRIEMGSWWVERMLKWIKIHSSDNFFVWGHYFHVHFLAEKELLFSGKIDKDKLSDFAYLDAKMKYMDKCLFEPLISLLKELGIWDNTVIIITSDHGETLGTDALSWKTYYFEHPQHKTMYESDLKVPLIIKDKRIRGRKIDCNVRSIDIVPTIFDLLNISGREDCDGISLLPIILEGESLELIAYSEELFENRGAGALQAVRSSQYKLIRNNTKNELEFYNLQTDPNEKINIVNICSGEEQKIFQKLLGIMNSLLEDKIEKIELDKEDKSLVEKQLRGLGYIQ